ncbi:MAG: ankyrin repeat domain-containing protein [Legionella sp.]|uniref:ankyrin repeat domain-containing protein n=1 Tax=Legionella sp. TaxID=459 RepID=UPI0039E6996E
MGYQNLEEGLCAGLGGMWLQAVFAEDEATFYQRLEFISGYKERFSDLIQEIKQAQRKQNKDLTSTDEQLVDIPAFFDGIKLYLHPDQGYFSNEFFVTPHHISTIFSAAKSDVLKKKEIELLFDKNCCFTKALLTHFIQDLESILSKTQDSIPIILNSVNHQICLKYNKEHWCWDYVDTNDFERFPEDDQYVRELNIYSLVGSIFASFFTRDYAVFNIQILTTSVNDSLKNELHQFDLKYPLDATQLKYDSLNTSVFHLACRHGDLETVKEFLKPEMRTDVNQATYRGGAPLHIACQNGHVKVVQELLKPEVHANVNQANNNGATPLHIACQDGHVEIVQELLKPEVHVNVNQAMNDGATPLHVACQNGHVEIVQELLKPEVHVNVNQAMNNGVTPLHIACQNGHVGVVQKLLKPEAHANVNQATDEGVTPLHVACQNGHVEIVQELLNPKMHVDVNQAMNNGGTPLHIACQNGYVEVVQELLKPEVHVNVNQAMNNGLTPLLIACQYGHLKIVEEILSQTQLNPINFDTVLFVGNDTQKEEMRITALDVAISTNNKILISMLIDWISEQNYSLPMIISPGMLNTLIHLDINNQYLPKLQHFMDGEQLQRLFSIKYDLSYSHGSLTQLGLFNQNSKKVDLILNEILRQAKEGQSEYTNICIELGWLNQENHLNLHAPKIIHEAYSVVDNEIKCLKF